jgi:predicted DsbA family dithiol-disulfide isomerase
MKPHLKIDIVSDVVCPWCAIGLEGVQQALAELGDSVSAELHFKPFELNPQMGPEGQDITEHLVEKYGSTPEQMDAAREGIRARGAALGFTFNMKNRDRIYNTFDSHRLLHWAAEVDASGKQQIALKQALLKAYFTDGENPSDAATLVRVAASVGLDTKEAEEVLSSGRYADAVRAEEQFYLQQGIHSVPAVIINDRHLISGGQPPEMFAQAFRQIASAAA